MAETFGKKEREKKRDQKRKEKLARKEERKDTAGGGNWESMMAYVDENGVLHDSPPDPTRKKVEIDAENIEIGIPRRSEDEEQDFTLTGIVNYFDATKGFGFIKTADDENFFVHQNNVSGTLIKGNKVQFEKEKGAKGWTAIKVVLVK